MAEYQLFVAGRIHALIILIAIAVITLWYMSRKKLPYIRRVPALDAIDEAIGRSTEMGRPIICSYGNSSDGLGYWTVSGLSILTHVAGACARSDTRLLVPCGGHPNSYTSVETARALVRTQYRLAGKSEAYNEENLPFLSGRQFPWASAYVGMLLREKPGANILVGTQQASAMYMAEVTNQVGALGISSAGYLSNIACLSVTSDYTIIGEEQCAAGAYLSQDLSQLSSIRTQDIFKIVAIAIIALGVIVTLLGSNFMIDLMST